MRTHWKIISLNLIAALGGLYLAVFGLQLPGKAIDPNTIDGLFWPNQKQLSSFELIDHNKQRYDLNSFEGQWNMLFFGYTNCPDICPLTMSTLSQVNKMLKAEQSDRFADMQVHFISVDGARDNPDHLNNYITFFGPEFLAASGTKTQVDSLTSQLGVPYAIEDHEPGENYLVSHSGALFLISPDGKLYSLFQAPYTAEQITRNLATISDFLKQQS